MREHHSALPRRFELLSLAIILLVAASLRFWRLDDIPPAVYYDEAVNAYEAGQIWNGQLRIFFRANQGREPLYMYLLAVSELLVGERPLAIRYTSAAIGLLTVAAAYVALRRLFGSRPALLATFLLATSYWHLSLSRMGFRVVLLPLLASLALYFLLRALERKSVRDAGLAGLWLGMIAYSYTAGRATMALFGLILVAILLIPTWRPSLNFRSALALSGLIVAVAIVVCLPLGYYFYRHPRDFSNRAASVSLFAREGGVNPVEIANNALVTLGGVLWQGDPNSRHNLPGRPIFDPALSLLFLIGTGIAVSRISRFPYALTLAWVASGLSVGAVAIEAPHFLRLAGLIPFVYLIPALAGDGLLRLATTRTTTIAPLAAGWILVGLLGAGQLVATAADYFVVWPQRPDVLDSYQADYRLASSASQYLPANALTLMSTGFVGTDGPAPAYLYPLAERELRYFNGRECLPVASNREEETYYLMPQSNDDPQLQIHRILERIGPPTVYYDQAGRPAVHVYRGDNEALLQEFQLERTLSARFDPWFVVHGYQLPRKRHLGSL